ncbi:MAG: YtxH domain-containing protein [Bryobacterales bacterium]|nr:YtxH domain-containing protein [Bryobacterales bacterium]
MAEESKFPYFLLGLGVGFVAGILVAPRSGDETIQYLKERAEEGRGYLKDRVGESREYLGRQQESLKSRAQDAVEKGREALLRQKEQIAAAYDAGRQAYRASVDAGAAAAETVQGQGDSI